MAKQQPELALAVGVRSERGRREDNQDKMSAFSTPLGMVYVVADGMGGYRGGAEASRRVVDGFQRYLNASGLAETESLQNQLADQIARAALQTNAEILAESTAGDPTVEGMGSTVVLALLRSTADGIEMLAAHIGDSRAYLFRQGTLYRITRDHSLVQRMVDTGLLTPEQALHHPDSNVLSRAIGKQPEAEIETGQLFSLFPGDTVLLCTDGLWGSLGSQQIAEALNREAGVQEVADVLVQHAYDNGSDDNITVQVVRLEARLAEPPAPFCKRSSQPAAPLPPPPGVADLFSLAPQPEPSSPLSVSSGGRRKLKPTDLVFVLLALLVVAALAIVVGYEPVKALVNDHRAAEERRQTVPAPPHPPQSGSQPASQPR